MKKQNDLFAIKDSPEAAVCADKLVEMYDQEKELKEAIKTQSARMVEFMEELGKKAVKHKGYTIEVKETEAKKKIKISGIKKKEDTSDIADEGKKRASKN